MNDLVLAKIDKARLLLAEAKTVQEAKQIADVAEAARVYAKRVEASIETVNNAAEIKIRAERLLGEMLAKSPKNRGALRRGRTQRPRGNQPTLKEARISKDQSARSQKLAKIPVARFERTISEKKAARKEITTSGVLRDAIEPSSSSTEGDSEETCWRRGLIYRAKASAGSAVFEDWSKFKVDLELVNLAARAAQEWQKTADYLKKIEAAAEAGFLKFNAQGVAILVKPQPDSKPQEEK